VAQGGQADAPRVKEEEPVSSIIDRITELGIVPVVVIDDPADAPALAVALRVGGLPIAEFTFRTDAAVAAIRAVAAACPDVLVGAGSVLLPGQVDAAVEAGARFIVSPGIDDDVVLRALGHGVASLPGCATPSDLMHARRLGLDCVKFFPAEAVGGIEMLKAIAAPFPGLRFVPTGGIDPDNMAVYLSDRRVVAVGGSWMVKPAVVRARDWAAVSASAREAVAAVQRLREG
jgi:2-dehydro-3-deoxyphosphogluconate aldolase/(4S)-4-hydroxy-2-oxoglutarate aldolase